MRAFAVLAAVLLVLAPSVDAAAHAATRAVEAGNTSLTNRIMSACDVVEDILDHLPGDGSSAHQHHIQAAFAPERLELASLSMTEPLSWPLERNDHSLQSLPTRIKRPPRV